MTMYAILKDVSPQPDDPKYDVFFAEDLPDAKAIMEEEGPACLYMENHHAEMAGESIRICRGHMSHAGVEPAFFDDGVHFLVLELLELRRRFNNGERLELGEVGDELLCMHCQLPETHHGLPTVKCDGYTLPEVRKEMNL